MYIISGLSKEYVINKNKVVAFKDISFDIKEKEFFCIMGPSGCGKSSLLKTLFGIEKPTSGSIVFDGKEYDNGIPSSEFKNIGYVYQNDNLLPWRSVEGNLRVPLEIFGLKDKEWLSRIDEMLKLVGLYEYRDALPRELSGGMKQRVGIARALVYNPEVVLMDQPFSALDAITRNIIVNEFISIWDKTKKTFVMVTNDLHEAILCGNRVLVFSKEAEVKPKIIEIDIPFEKRNPDIIFDKRYKELRSELQQFV
jgi:NitT/TauT family transport system ATP-binding protein